MILKSIANNVVSAIIASFPSTVSIFLGVGFIMFILSGLSDSVSVSTGWTITLVPTLIAFVYDIHKLVSNPGQVRSDFHRIKKSRYGFDNDGNEIDFYKGKRCCGNCKFNRGRPAYTSIPWCDKEGYYTDIYIIPNSVTLKDRKSVTNDYCCRNWKHF